VAPWRLVMLFASGSIRCGLQPRVIRNQEAGRCRRTRFNEIFQTLPAMSKQGFLFCVSNTTRGCPKQKDEHDETKSGVLMMPGSRTMKLAQGNESFPPVGSAYWIRTNVPGCLELDLHSKGFGGGVPLNTERTAVNLRAG